MKKKRASKADKSPKTKGQPVQLRLEPDLEAQIAEISRLTGLKKVEIIRRCARLGAELIVRDGYKLPPIKPVQGDSQLPQLSSDTDSFPSVRNETHRSEREP